jgi:microcystin degradation protein MlrC
MKQNTTKPKGISDDGGASNTPILSGINRREFLREAALTTLVAGGVVWEAGVSLAEAEPSGPAAKRIFFARFMHETNTFHPLPTTRYNFFDAVPKPSSMLADWKQNGMTPVPGQGAEPDGGGTVKGDACREAVAHIVKSLRDVMPVDGVFLQLHGAMFALGVGAGETLLVEEIRRVVGPQIPIACTFDLHGNIPARMGQAGDILVGLKTAPHTDQEETALHAGALLRDALFGKIKPVSCVIPVPIIVQGEKAMTTSEPMRSLVAEARRLEQEGLPDHKGKILAATVFVGCAWTDSPDTGMAAAVTADGSPETARAAAAHLARKIWEARHQFAFGCENAELADGVSKALHASEATVFLTDSGDNVTASAPGDLPVVLRHLVGRKTADAVVADLYDPAATGRCFEAGEGKQVKLSIGATIEKRYGRPLKVKAEVVRLVQGKPRMAVIRIGTVLAILSDEVVSFRSPEQFQACGIDPLGHKIVVVKQGYLYPKLTKIAPRHIMLMTPGAADMRIEKLPYVRRRKPLFPLEPDATFGI